MQKRPLIFKSLQTVATPCQHKCKTLVLLQMSPISLISDCFQGPGVTHVCSCVCVCVCVYVCVRGCHDIHILNAFMCGHIQVHAREHDCACACACACVHSLGHLDERMCAFDAALQCSLWGGYD